MHKHAAAILLALLLPARASAADFKQAQASGKQLRLTTASGKVVTIKEHHAVRALRLAPDGMAAAWLLDDEVSDSPAGARYAATLVVYRKGQRATLACKQAIRAYWFVQQGKHIAFDCGGHHFDGDDVLFDTVTLKEIERFHQADVPSEKRPPWSAH